jgi:hypothetical protein
MKNRGDLYALTVESVDDSMAPNDKLADMLLPSFWHHPAQSGKQFEYDVASNIRSARRFAWRGLSRAIYPQMARFRIGLFSLTVWRAPDHGLPPGQPFF